jgi:hypothetical protein
MNKIELKTLYALNEALRGRGDFPTPYWGQLDEAGFSRVLGHIGQGGFALITAFRHDYSMKVNRQRNQALLSGLSAMKMGPVLVTGHWEEAPTGMDWLAAKAAGKTVDVVEESFFVPCPKDMDQKDFERILHGMGNKFEQDSVLFGREGKGYVIDLGGTKRDIGSLSVGTIAKGYTTMRNMPGRKFTFEGTSRPHGTTSARLFELLGLRYVGEDGLLG